MPDLTIIYSRVSTRQQDTASQDLDLTRWQESNPGPAEWVYDKFTGKTMERPGWGRVWDLVAGGKVRRVVVWRLDRLGRTAAGLCQLFDDLNQRKVDLISLRDGFDLATPSGRLQAGILASVAQFEREIREERQRMGIEAAKNRTAHVRQLHSEGMSPEQIAGRERLRVETVERILAHPGRSVYWGGMRALKPGQAEDDVERINELRSRGNTYGEIAKIMGLSRQTVYSRLRSAQKPIVETEGPS